MNSQYSSDNYQPSKLTNKSDSFFYILKTVTAKQIPPTHPKKKQLNFKVWLLSADVSSCSLSAVPFSNLYKSRWPCTNFRAVWYTVTWDTPINTVAVKKKKNPAKCQGYQHLNQTRRTAQPNYILTGRFFSEVVESEKLLRRPRAVNRPCERPRWKKTKP